MYFDLSTGKIIISIITIRCLFKSTFGAIIWGNFCFDDEFLCQKGSRYECIQNSLVCDGIKDCDNFDETSDCDYSDLCQAGEFLCEDIFETHFCFPDHYRCDGERDCLDYSDELHCEESISRKKRTISKPKTKHLHNRRKQLF